MDSLHTLLLIIIQIVGESLPISSSSHTYLFTCFANSTQLPEFIDHFLHGPTLLILAIFFRKHLTTLLALFTTTTSSQKRIFNLFTTIIIFTSITTGITIIGYFLLKTTVMSSLFNNYRRTFTLIGLQVTAGFLFLSRYIHQQSPKKLNFTDAIILGCTQMLALLPGISRFASTLVVASVRGYSPKQAFRLAFLIEVPLLIPAFFIHGVPEFLQPQNFQFFTAPFTLLTLACATGLGYFALCVSWRAAMHNNFWKFSWYLLIPISLLLFSDF